MNIFFDTDILIDVVAERKEFYDASAAVWSRVADRRVNGFVAAISFNNVFYITRKASGAAAAAEAVKLIRDTFRMVPLDLPILDAALSSDMTDFEDAIQYFSAAQASASYLVTRNVQDFPLGGLPVGTPEALLAILAASGQST